MNPAALQDFLDCLSQSVHHAEQGNIHAAEMHRFAASRAAAEAFDPGTDEARALSVILAAAGRVPEMT